MSRFKSRYSSFPFESRMHKGKPIKDLTASKEWNAFYVEVKSLPSRVAIVPAGMDGRPDLLAYKLYGSSNYWWVLCVANSIIDPFEQLTAGKQIRVPIID